MIILLLFSFLTIVTADERYLKFDMYKASGCNEDSLVGYFLLTMDPTGTFFRSNCTNYPFYYQYTQFEYNQLNDSVKWMVHNTENCDSNDFNNTKIFKIRQCELSKDENQFYYRFDVALNFPIDKSTKSGWFVGEYFTDNECREPVSRLGFFNYDRYFGVDSRIDGGDYLFAVDYCTSEYIVFPSLANSGDYHYLPIRNNNNCSLYYGFSFSNSFIPGCYSQEEAERIFIGELPAQSKYEYQIRYSAYDVNCTNHASIQPVPLDHCSSQGTKTTSSNSRVASMTYQKDTNCQGDIVAFSITPTLEENIRSLYGHCEIAETKEVGGESQTIYGSMEMMNDPYFPTLMAGFYTLDAECGDDIIPIIMNPKSLPMLYYFNEDECVSSALFDYGDIDALPGSFRGFCEKGRLTVISYPNSQVCLGLYMRHEFNGIGQGFCTEYESRFSFHLTCIPRFCGLFSEDDLRVCNARGVCVGNDLCSCDGGYLGRDCESYQCYGIDSTNEEDVCHGNGICKSPDTCVCDSGFSGEVCDRNFLVIFGIISASVLFLVFVAVIVFVCIVLFFCWVCVVLFFCLIAIGLCCCCCTVCSSGVFAISQRKKLSKFRKLDDFDLLLKEQILEKDHSRAHIRVDKTLFEIPYDEVKILEIIGEGGSGSIVYYSTWKGRKVAFKCFKTRDLAKSGNFESFEKEVNLLVTLNHPNVIRFYGACVKPPRIGILMEYCKNGEILKFLLQYKTKNEKLYAMTEKFRMIQEVISSMDYLHSRSIMHRDLKSENILIDETETCKLNDFGLSRVFENKIGNVASKTRRIGTKFYMAPEVMNGRYDEKCDTFSFGILLWVIICEQNNPYATPEMYSSGSSELMLTLNSLEFRVATDPEFRPDVDIFRKRLGEHLEEYEWIIGVMEKCWAHEPESRYSFKELVDIFRYNLRGGQNIGRASNLIHNMKLEEEKEEEEMNNNNTPIQYQTTQEFTKSEEEEERPLIDEVSEI